MNTDRWIKLLLLIVIVLTLIAVALLYRSVDDSWRNEQLEGHGIFSVVESGESGIIGNTDYYAILMHNDTGVLYYYHSYGHAESMTPLYNEDGTVMTIWQRLEE